MAFGHLEFANATPPKSEVHFGSQLSSLKSAKRCESMDFDDRLIH